MRRTQRSFRAALLYLTNEAAGAEIRLVELKVHIVRLELKGHVQDPAGNDALRLDYTIRGIPSGELRPSRRYGLIAGLCVVPDDDNNSELTIYTKVVLES